MALKRVDEKFPGQPAAVTAVSDGVITGAVTYLFLDALNSFKTLKPGQLLSWGLISGGVGLLAGVVRYVTDKKTQDSYEEAARSNNEAVEAVIKLDTDNKILRASLESERTRFTDMVSSRHTTNKHAEHASGEAHTAEHHEKATHTSHAAQHEKAGHEHVSHAAQHESKAHSSHAAQHTQHETHSEKAVADKHAAADAQLSA